MSCIITHKGKRYSEEQFKEYFINNKQEFVTSIAKNKDVMDSFKRKMEGIDFVFSQSPELASIGSKTQYLEYLSTIFPNSKVKDIVYHISDKTLIPKKGQLHFYTDFSTRNSKNYKFHILKNVESKLINKETDEKNSILNSAENYIFDNFNYEFFTAEWYRDPLNFYNEIANKAKEDARTDVIEYLRGKETFAILNIQNPHNENIESLNKTTVDAIKNNIKTDGIIGQESWGYGLSKTEKEVVVFDPEQIHILSSKKDLEMFRNFINFTKSEYAKHGDIQQFRDYIMSKNFAAIEEFLVVNNKIGRKC